MKVDANQWKLEVERVTPMLKVTLGNDNKDWRVHWQQLQHYSNVH
jgi:estrogen-related receptor beta like 1